ncbi:MAG: hypothetical protein N3A58_01990 [Spirochaetes bacterium]|nr:hypothetical protein [Spirochaetota bacterium]
MTNLILCGKIISTFGKEGYIKLKKYNFEDDYFFNIERFYLDKEGFYYLEKENIKKIKDIFLVKFKNVDKIEIAYKLCGFILFGKLDFKYLKKDAVIYKLEQYKIILKDDLFKTYETDLKIINLEISKEKSYFNILVNGIEYLLPIEDFFVEIDNKNKIVKLKNLNEVINLR